VKLAATFKVNIGNILIYGWVRETVLGKNNLTRVRLFFH